MYPSRLYLVLCSFKFKRSIQALLLRGLWPVWLRIFNYDYYHTIKGHVLLKVFFVCLKQQVTYFNLINYSWASKLQARIIRILVLSEKFEIDTPSKKGFDGYLVGMKYNRNSAFSSFYCICIGDDCYLRDTVTCSCCIFWVQNSIHSWYIKVGIKVVRENRKARQLRAQNLLSNQGFIDELIEIIKVLILKTILWLQNSPIYIAPPGTEI